MNIDLTNVTLGIDTNFNAVGTAEILQNVAVIISTPAGSVIGDRGFGIDFTIVDKPYILAKGLLIQEYTRKVKTYEPRARVIRVTFKQDPLLGVIIPKVVITIVSS